MGMPSPGYEPQPVPQSTIYGPGARRYGGPNYGILRPESGPGMPGPGYDARPAPRSSIYGPQSRYSGGPNYGHLRPGYEGYGYQGGPGWGPWDNRPRMGQGRGIYNQPGRYQGPGGDATDVRTRSSARSIGRWMRRREARREQIARVPGSWRGPI